LFDLVCDEALLGVGIAAERLELPRVEIQQVRSLSLLGSEYLLLGKALQIEAVDGRGDANVRRAHRILESAVNKPAEIHADALSRNKNPGTGLLASPTAFLDSAVALLELSGHPHILGREAFVLIQESGCAEAVALVATGGPAPRVILAHGWTAHEALAAVRAAEDGQLIPVGLHLDETWHLLVRPADSLDHRCTLASIRKLIGTAVTLDRYRRDEKQRTALWPVEALEGDPESIWASEQAAEILTIARRIAATPLPVLLTGETGTGKEMLARAIHKASDRAGRALVPFNCSAVPRDLIESQLFGYRKGAFTGAEASFPGVIRATAGGTLFLDEIADIPIELQPKLLRFLEHQEIQPLGETQPLQVDVRIIAATNANLDRLVAEGRFREDLLYRLNVIQLQVPPLRERREEIPTLVQHYIRRFATQQKKGELTLSDETLEYLLLYSWPGNIRQLANEVRRMVALAEPDSTLTPTLLSSDIQSSRRTVPASPSGLPEIRLPLDQPLPIAVEHLEQMLVRRALERSHGRVEEAARMLGISRKGLFLKRRRWGLQQAS
jgi:DNA-binding NtrC family response regulator